jgi:hypothetical protein
MDNKIQSGNQGIEAMRISPLDLFERLISVADTKPEMDVDKENALIAKINTLIA